MLNTVQKKKEKNCIEQLNKSYNNKIKRRNKKKKIPLNKKQKAIIIK